MSLYHHCRHTIFETRSTIGLEVFGNNVCSERARNDTQKKKTTKQKKMRAKKDNFECAHLEDFRHRREIDAKRQRSIASKMIEAVGTQQQADQRHVTRVHCLQRDAGARAIKLQRHIRIENQVIIRIIKQYHQYKYKV
jgi:hypothetical protein